MSIIQNDNRELKISVQLSAISNSDIGQASAQYSIDSQVPDPSNTRSIFTDNFINNPEIIIGNFRNPIKEFRYGNKISSLPSVQNAKLSQVSTFPSPSSCTFAFGGIAATGDLPDTTKLVTHPVFNLLYGPMWGEYRKYNSPIPVVTKKIPGLKSPETGGFLDNRDNLKPFIPFVEFKFTIVERTNVGPIPIVKLNSSPTDSQLYWSELNLRKNQKKLTSYNIWNTYSKASNTIPETALTDQVILYEGPVPRFVNNINQNENFSVYDQPYIYTIRDGLNGSKVYVDCAGKKKSGVIKRIFPTSKDAVFYDTTNPNKEVYDTTGAKNFPQIFYPTRLRYKKSISNDVLDLARDYVPSTSRINDPQQDVFIMNDSITAQGLDNCGFHIHLSDLNANAENSNITLEYENTNPKDNSLYYVAVILTPNSLPKVLVKYLKNGSIEYKEFSQLKAEKFDGKATLGYDIFIHFLGPVMLIGFTTDQSQWNAIYPEKLDDTKYIDNFFEKDKSFVKFIVTNVNFAFNYSTIIFDNYSLDLKFPTTNKTTNDLELKSSKKYIWDEVPLNLNYFGDLYSRYNINPLLGGRIDKLNTKNYILIELQAPKTIVQNVLSENSLLNNLINNKFMNSFSTYFNNLPKRDISLFGDWRSQHQPTTITNYFKDYNIKEIYKSYLTGLFGYDDFPNENRAKVWHKLLTNSTIEGSAWLSIEADSLNTLKDKKEFLHPIFDTKGNPLNIADFVDSININFSSENVNASRISRTCTLGLANLDSSDIGWKILELMEHNILVVTVLAGYDINNLHNFFEGVINDITTTRTGSSSNTSIECIDLGNYILDNLFFDNIHSFSTRALGDCIKTVVEASGFGDYYHVENSDNIGFLNSRISSNATTPQDTQVSLATPFDKIGDKLNIFLEKLVQLEKQGTFRWEPDSDFSIQNKAGFILDARYASSNIDDDFKFTGIDPITNTITSVPDNPNSNSINDPGWHGLLTDSYKIKTNISTLAYKVETLGYTNLKGVKTKEFFIPNSLENVSSIQNALSNTNIPKGFIGFRKKVLDLIDRTKIFDEEGIQQKHEQNIEIVKNPFHTIEFDCYITKPLKFHGTFVVKAFLDNNDLKDLNNTKNYIVTDQYIYQSLTCSIDKKENLIKASVTGMRQPWTIRDLEEAG
jgi:hypothetical protein